MTEIWTPIARKPEFWRTLNLPFGTRRIVVDDISVPVVAGTPTLGQVHSFAAFNILILTPILRSPSLQGVVPGGEPEPETPLEPPVGFVFVTDGNAFVLDDGKYVVAADILLPPAGMLFVVDNDAFVVSDGKYVIQEAA